MKIYDNKTAIELIEGRFPALSEELRDDDWSELLHLQIAVFSRMAQSVIDAGDRAVWEKVSQTFWGDAGT